MVRAGLEVVEKGDIGILNEVRFTNMDKLTTMLFKEELQRVRKEIEEKGSLLERRNEEIDDSKGEILDVIVYLGFRVLLVKGEIRGNAIYIGLNKENKLLEDCK